MKINKLILKILTLYFSIYIVLFCALYLMMPSFFNILSVALNVGLSSLVLFCFIFMIIKKINHNPKTTADCDCIYRICKISPLCLYVIGLVFPLISMIIFRTKQAVICSLISIFSSNISYIFSQRYFSEILHFSESNLRAKTLNIANINSFIKDIPESINMIIELIPIIILNLAIGLCLYPLNYVSIIYIISLLIISILSVIYISLNYYLNLKTITQDLKDSKKINYNNEFSNLAFRINATKQIYNDYIDQLKNIQNKELEKERLSSIEIIRRTVDAKDTYTRGHSDRVSEYSVLLGQKLGLSFDELQILKIGGLFHDIGKIGIPDRVLLKEGKLTDEEYAEIKKHPSIGAHILDNSEIFDEMIPLVLHHHERYDGKGYPDGLKGNDIPYMARIVAVADTFDAMTSKRVYRNSLPIDIVKSEFEKCSGSQFDPDIAKEFLDILNNDYEKIENIMNL